MGTISYDPIKDRFARFIRHSRFLRRFFYFLLDLFFLRSWHIRCILKEEGENLDKKGEWKLLDAGCGFGQYDRFILKQFEHVEILSVDVKKDYLDDCANYFRKEIESGKIEFKQADLLELKVREEFDFVICIDVLEHIEDDQQVINNLAAALKPGGRLLMHSPSHYSENDAGDAESFVGEHARIGYSKDEINQKYRKAGITADRLHYTYGKFGRTAWVLTVKFPMLLLNKVGMGGVLLLLLYYPVILPPCLILNLADLYTINEKGTGIYALGTRS